MKESITVAPAVALSIVNGAAVALSGSKTPVDANVAPSAELVTFAPTSVGAGRPVELEPLPAAKVVVR